MTIRTPVEIEQAKRARLQEQFDRLQSKYARQVARALSEAEIDPPPDLGRSEQAAYRLAVDEIRAALAGVAGRRRG